MICMGLLDTIVGDDFRCTTFGHLGGLSRGWGRMWRGWKVVKIGNRGERGGVNKLESSLRGCELKMIYTIEAELE